MSDGDKYPVFTQNVRQTIMLLINHVGAYTGRKSQGGTAGLTTEELTTAGLTTGLTKAALTTGLTTAALTTGLTTAALTTAGLTTLRLATPAGLTIANQQQSLKKLHQRI